MAVNRPPRESSGGPRGPKRQHRKGCSFCVEKFQYIDYKEISRLRRFVSDRGKILPRRVTGTCARHQRPLTPALEPPRAQALPPPTSGGGGTAQGTSPPPCGEVGTAEGAARWGGPVEFNAPPKSPNG